MKRHLVLTLLLLLYTVSVSAQTERQATTREQAEVVQQLIRDRELTSDCVRREGGPSEIVGISFTDLNSDGVPELIVGGTRSCACAARRCYQWVYRRANTSYELLLSAGPVDEITPLRTATNGYRDLRVITPVGDSATIQTYRFDGRHYTNQRVSSSVGVARSGSTRRSRASNQMSDVVTFVSHDGGQGNGVYNLRLNGRVESFDYNSRTRIDNSLGHPQAYNVGAEWRIVYSREPSSGGTHLQLLGATFTGRVIDSDRNYSGSPPVMPRGSSQPPQRLYTPEPNSVERRAIMDALRTNVRNVRGLRGSIIFAVRRLNVQNGWAFIVASPQSPDGQPLREFQERCEFDQDVIALLRRRANRWQVVERDVCPSDVSYGDWGRRHGAPRTIFGLN